MLVRPALLRSRPAARIGGVLLVVTVVASAALAKRAVEPAAAPGAETSPAEAFVGIVQPGDVISVTASAAMTVADTLVGVGDGLEAGDPIVRIDSALGEREVAERSLDLARAAQEVVDRERMVGLLESSIQRLLAESADAPAQLALAEREAQQIPMRQARDSPARAQLAYDQARMKEDRRVQLYAAGLVPKQDVEDAHFEVRLAADDLANATLAAEAARRVHVAQGQQARATRRQQLADERRQLAEQQAALHKAGMDLTAARMRQESASSAIADPFVRAPRAGAILERFVHTGDRVTAGALVARMASLDSMAVDIDLAPMLVNAIRVGDVAFVDVPATEITGREARIRSIAPLPGEDGKYAIQLSLPNPAGHRLAGQVAHVRLRFRDRMERP